MLLSPLRVEALAGVASSVHAWVFGALFGYCLLLGLRLFASCILLGRNRVAIGKVAGLHSAVALGVL